MAHMPALLVSYNTTLYQVICLDGKRCNYKHHINLSMHKQSIHKQSILGVYDGHRKSSNVCC